VHLEGMFERFLSSKGFLVACCELPMVALIVKLWFSPLLGNPVLSSTLLSDVLNSMWSL